MIDFPLTALLDDSIGTLWLERRLYPDGLQCDHGGSTVRRLFRGQGHFPAPRGRAYDGSSTLLTGTVFGKTRQRPATLVFPRPCNICGGTGVTLRAYLRTFRVEFFDMLGNTVAVMTLLAGAPRAPRRADRPAVRSHSEPVTAQYFTRAPYFPFSLTLPLSQREGECREEPFP